MSITIEELAKAIHAIDLAAYDDAVPWELLSDRNIRLYRESARAVVRLLEPDIEASWEARYAYPTREAFDAQARLTSLLADVGKDIP